MVDTTTVPFYTHWGLEIGWVTQPMSVRAAIWIQGCLTEGPWPKATAPYVWVSVHWQFFSKDFLILSPKRRKKRWPNGNEITTSLPLPLHHQACRFFSKLVLTWVEAMTSEQWFSLLLWRGHVALSSSHGYSGDPVFMKCQWLCPSQLLGWKALFSLIFHENACALSFLFSLDPKPCT